MPATKPRLFIGSSSENLKIAYAIQENLDHDFEATVWNQSVFDLSRSTLETLVAKVPDFDAAVFVFSPDDVASVRGKAKQFVRDNVVFELGLFIGQLGREPTFIVGAPRHRQSRFALRFAWNHGCYVRDGAVRRKLERSAWSSV